MKSQQSNKNNIMKKVRTEKDEDKVYRVKITTRPRVTDDFLLSVPKGKIRTNQKEGERKKDHFPTNNSSQRYKRL